MKVCILSMQRIDNMGSLLQAYALKNMIERYVKDKVEFIDILRIEDDYNLLGDFSLDFKKEVEKTGFVGRLSKIDKYLLNRIRIRAREKEQRALFEEFRNNYLELFNKSDEYDLCVIGSDEVFNCLNAGAWGFTTQLFGNVKEAKQVITYAASCGATCINDVPKKIQARIQASFGNIRNISVRDKNTYEFVTALTNKKVVENLDPVIVYDFSKEMDREEVPGNYKDYCIVYSYRNRIYRQNEIRSILNFCKNNRLHPVAVGAPQAWIKDFAVCNPFQCMKLFEKASFVITDTFHGTIFSFKYAKKFAIMLRDSNQNKLSDLVNRLMLQEHLISSFEELPSKILIEKDCNLTKKIIANGRSNAENYLKENLCLDGKF